MIEQNTSQPIFTVTQLNENVKKLLESNLKRICVAGEISNLSVASSGHAYFSLKDPQSQLRCAWFGYQKDKALSLSNGQAVIVTGRLSLYVGRGDYQCLVESIDLTGNGALQQSFEALKKRLMLEGLFNPEHKKPLPAIRQNLGIITSLEGAALQDILSVLKRRNPSVQVWVYPTLVQGDKAAEQIIQALALAHRHAQADVLIVARGGGSMEDLWCFNDERLARAVYASRIPIVSGVGHEIDFTIIDFVSDHRAPTPSAAAEWVSSDRQQLRVPFEQQKKRLWHAWKRIVQSITQKFQGLNERLERVHPKNWLMQRYQRLDEAELRLERGFKGLYRQSLKQLHQYSTRLWCQNPYTLCLAARAQLLQQEQRLWGAVQHSMRWHKQRLTHLSTLLHHLSPLAVVHRGYSVLRDQSTQQWLEEPSQLHVGQTVEVLFRDACVNCQVLSVKPTVDGTLDSLQ